MALATLTASFRSAPLSQDRIDHENGVLYGVKIAVLGKEARWQGKDGVKSTVVSEEHIDAFLRLAGDRSIVCHWTHDYSQTKADPLSSQVGSHKKLRRDEVGDLVGDLHLSPSPFRQTILWNAMNHPEEMMISPVFKYSPDDKRAIPLTFKAADLVENGAATVALFSAPTEPDTTMTAEEIQKLIDDGVTARFAARDAEQAALETARLAAAPAAPETFTKEDVEKLVTARFAEVESQLVTKAEAQFTKALGANGFQLNASIKGTDKDPAVQFQNLVTAEMRAHPELSEGRAMANVARANSDLYAKRDAALKNG